MKNICDEFDCNQEFAAEHGSKCGGDFTKEPCLFLSEHKILNGGAEVSKEVSKKLDQFQLVQGN